MKTKKTLQTLHILLIFKDILYKIKYIIYSIIITTAILLFIFFMGSSIENSLEKTKDIIIQKIENTYE